MRIKLQTLIIISELCNCAPNTEQIFCDSYLKLCEDIIAVDKSHGHDRSITVMIKTPDGTGQDSDDFILNYEHLVRVSQNIGALQYVSLNNVQKILLPSKVVCCNKVLNIIDTYAWLKVYTEDGVVDGRSYHGKCRVCGILHYHGFSLDKKKKIHIFEKPENGSAVQWWSCLLIRDFGKSEQHYLHRRCFLWENCWNP